MVVRDSKFLLFLTFSVSVMLVFLTPPSVFAHADFMSLGLRATLGLAVMLLLFMAYPRLTVFDVYAFLFVFLLFSVEIMRKKSELSNILSYYAVIVFYVLLFRTLYKRKSYREYFLRLWIYVAYFISAAAIIIFVLHQFTPLNTDIFGFKSLLNIDKINFEYSFLGVTVDKNFGVFTLARVYSYFIEPQYAALYFIINMFLSRELCKIGDYRWLFVLSLLAGILTFSVTFHLALVIFCFLQYTKTEFKFVAVVCLLAVVSYIYSGNIVVDDYMQHTSYSDRAYRMLNSLDILENASFGEFMFGHGVGFTNNSNRGLSSGVFRIFVERGLTGLLFVLLMSAIYLNKNYIWFLIIFLFLFAVPWYANYVYWMGILMLWAAGVVVRTRLLDMEYNSCQMNV